jgi:hypothetical protein
MYAAKVEDGTVVQVIVGDPRMGGSDRLGGMWLPSDVKVGVGWQVVDGTITPPEPDELEDTLDEPEFM